MAAINDVIDHVRHEVLEAEHHNGEASVEALTSLLIMAFMYYIIEDYENAEPLLVRYLSAIKEKFGANSHESFYGFWLLTNTYFSLMRSSEAKQVVQQAKAIPKEIRLAEHDWLEGVLYNRAMFYMTEGEPQHLQRGFVLALADVCWSVTSGLHRIPAGVQRLDHLRSFFGYYGIRKREWDWILRHAHLRTYDFIGLLSLLLPGIGIVAERAEAGPRARRPMNDHG